jgi:hypothetical protein
MITFESERLSGACAIVKKRKWSMFGRHARESLMIIGRIMDYERD